MQTYGEEYPQLLPLGVFFLLPKQMPGFSIDPIL